MDHEGFSIETASGSGACSSTMSTAEIRESMKRLRAIKERLLRELAEEEAARRARLLRRLLASRDAESDIQ